jgi:hypothetical protein
MQVEIDDGKRSAYVHDRRACEKQSQEVLAAVRELEVDPVVWPQGNRPGTRERNVVGTPASMKSIRISVTEAPPGTCRFCGPAARPGTAVVTG